MSSPEQNPYKNVQGLQRIINAIFYSCDGLKAAWKYEAAFRQVSIIVAISIGMSLYFPLSVTAKALLIGVSLLLLVIELFNSAIEAVVDYISLEKHPLAKRAKDMGSAAQLIGLINLCCVWLIIGYPLL